MDRWRDQAKHQKGLSATTKYKNADKWSSQDKFMVVLETANLTEIEFSEYCREKGVYPEQVKEWKEACINANDNARKKGTQAGKELRAERKEKEKLEKELARKEKALAEAAALLVLSLPLALVKKKFTFFNITALPPKMQKRKKRQKSREIKRKENRVG